MAMMALLAPVVVEQIPRQLESLTLFIHVAPISRAHNSNNLALPPTSTHADLDVPFGRRPRRPLSDLIIAAHRQIHIQR
jgi:hypothetical protein